MAGWQVEKNWAPEGDAGWEQDTVGNQALGAAKQLGVGAVKGTAALAGMGGDAREMIASGVNAASGALGYEIPKHVAADALRVAPLSGPLMGGPTSEQINKKVQDVAGEYRKPQNTLEEFTGSAGEMLPSALAGPGGLLRRAGMAAASGVASEGATHLPGVKGDPILEPAARAVGAMSPSLLEASLMRGTAPTSEALKQGYKGGYDKLKNQNTLFDKRDTDYLANSIEKELLGEGYRRVPGSPGSAVFHAVDELKTMKQAMNEGRSPNYHDIESVRKVLNVMGKSHTETDAVRRAKSLIDDFLVNIAGTKDARGNFAAFKRDQTVRDALEQANLQASATGTGANIDNAIRQKFKTILNNENKRRGFSDDELSQMRKIVEGTAMGNAMRFVGKLAPTGIVSGGIGAGLEHALFGGVKGILGMPGFVAKKASDYMTKRNADDLSRMVRARSPVGEAMGARPNIIQDVDAAKRAAFMRAIAASQGQE